MSLYAVSIWKIPPKITDPDNSIVNDYKKLFMSRQYSDIKFRTFDGNIIYAHKGILSVRAPFLFHLIGEHPGSLNGSFQTTEDEISSLHAFEYKTDVIEEVLRFIYYNEAENLDELAFKLYRAASDFDIGKLKRICYNYILLNLSSENAIEAFTTAQHVGAPKELIKRSFELIVE